MELTSEEFDLAESILGDEQSVLNATSDAPDKVKLGELFSGLAEITTQALDANDASVVREYMEFQIKISDLIKKL
jgi:hypothetical protein